MRRPVPAESAGSAAEIPARPMKAGRPRDVLLGMDGDIDDWREQYRQAPPGGPTAARAALALGLRLAARYLGEGAAEGDRDEAVDLLDEALTVSHDDVTRTHVVLGTLLFFRAVPIRPD